MCEVFGWRSLSSGSRGRKKVEEEEEEKEQERAAGGRRGGSFDSVFSSPYFAYSGAACLLACLHTLLTLGGSSRNLVRTLWSTQKLISFSSH